MKKIGFVLVAFAFFLSASRAQESAATVPEAGFISPDKYTNAYFGFSLPLPQDAAFSNFQLPSQAKGDTHNLFGLKAQPKNGLGLTAFMVAAIQMNGASSEQAHEVASRLKARDIKKIQIAGREFWKGQSEDSSKIGKMRNITYATAMNGYILQFYIGSFDGKLTKDLEQSIERLEFFEPSKAQEVAGPSSRAYNPLTSRNPNSQSIPSSNRIGELTVGTVSGNTYKNDALGFTYEFPAGWVVNDKATQDKTIEAGHQFAWGDSESAAREHEAFQRCSRVLLMVTKAPEGTVTGEVNPMIVILAVDLECSPGAYFPKTLDDHDGIKAMAHQLVHFFAGTPFVSKGDNSVRAFLVQNQLILDTSGAFQVTPSGGKAPLDVFTSIDVTELNGYLVGWAFMSGSQSGLQDLKKSNIVFATKQGMLNSAHP
jgi:hypothetical protein